MMLFSTPPSLRTPPLSHIRAQRRSTTHFLAFIVFYATRQNILTFSLAVSRSIAGCFCGAKYRGETEERQRRREGLENSMLYFEGLTPSPCGHSPYLIYNEQRESVESILLNSFYPLRCFVGIFPSSLPYPVALRGVLPSKIQGRWHEVTEGLNIIKIYSAAFLNHLPRRSECGCRQKIYC